MCRCAHCIAFKSSLASRRRRHRRLQSPVLARHSSAFALTMVAMTGRRDLTVRPAALLLVLRRSCQREVRWGRLAVDPLNATSSIYTHSPSRSLSCDAAAGCGARPERPAGASLIISSRAPRPPAALLDPAAASVLPACSSSSPKSRRFSALVPCTTVAKAASRVTPRCESAAPYRPFPMNVFAGL